MSRLAPLVIRFATLARREGFDAVYSFLTWTNIVVAAARLCGGRYLHIASEHAMAQSLRTDGSRLAVLARTLPLVYRLPDWIVVVSDEARRSLLAAGVLPRPERAVTIPNPVDGVRIRNLADATLQVPVQTAGRHLVACVARLHPQKDHATLLRAMVSLPSHYALVLAGDGALREELTRTVARLGLTDRVTFVGAVSNPYPLMRRAAVIVLPSREEGFGLVAAEAAVLGVPFIGSDVGGLGELCRTLGHRTFPVGDPEALARQILDSASAAQVNYVAADVVERLLDPTVVAAQYLRLAVPGRRRSRETPLAGHTR